jgi:hypothetical protein
MAIFLSIDLNHISIKNSKTHPKDFEHEGRLRVRMFKSKKEPINPNIANRQSLFDEIAKYLLSHTNKKESGESALKPHLTPRKEKIEKKKGRR